MKLPIQSQPIARKVSRAMILGEGIVSSQDCETECFRYCSKKISKNFMGTIEVYEQAVQNCVIDCKRHC
jgi:hypothetical protein